MLEIFKAFATQEDFQYEGAMIAKAAYQRVVLGVDSQCYKNQIVKSSKRLCVVKCDGYNGDDLIESLTVYLMMNPKVGETEEEKVTEGEYWYTFSSEEIREFSYSTGDTNSIHLSANPIVQGLFILMKLYELDLGSSIEVKYAYPVYGNKEVYLKHDQHHLSGYSGERLCFQSVFVDGDC
ncbi:MAG: hypothetical protein JXQ26_02150 [Tissierellales bacterium]|nr:hypothetical protein [Tissierellales bacterium]